MATDYIKQLLHASSVALYGNEAVTTGDVTFSKFQDNGGEPHVSEIMSCNSVKEIEGIVSTKANISDSMMKGAAVEEVPLFQDTQLKERKSKKIKGPHCFKSRDFTVSKVTDKPKNRVDEGASCIQESLSSSVVSLGGDSGVNIKKKKKGKKDKDGTGHVPQSNTKDSDILMEANTSDSKLRESMDKNVSLSVSKKCKKICKENDASTVVVYGNKAVKSTDAKVTKVRKQFNKKIKDAASNSILELIAASMVGLYGDFGSKLEKPKKVQDVHGQNLKQTIENDHQALSKVNALNDHQALSKVNALNAQTKVVEDNSLRVCKINTVPIEVQHDKAVLDSMSNKKLAKKNKVKQNKKKKSESFSQIIHDCSQASISSNKKKKKENSKHQNDTKKTISKDDRGSINNEIFITDSLTVKEETILPDLIDNAIDLDYDQLVEGDPLDLNSSYDSLMLEGVTEGNKENLKQNIVSSKINPNSICKIQLATERSKESSSQMSIGMKPNSVLRPNSETNSQACSGNSGPLPISPLLNPLISEGGSRSRIPCSAHPSPDLKTRSPILKTLSVSPDDKVRSRISRSNFPLSRSRSPLSRSHSPQSRSNSPFSRSSSPLSRSQSPQSRSTSPKSRSISPQSKSQSPQSRSQNPQSRSNSPQSKSQSPQSRSQNPQSRSNSPHSRSRSCESKCLSPVSNSSSSQTRNRSSVSRSISPQSRSISPQSRSISPQSRSNSIQSRSQSSQSRCLGPDSSSRSGSPVPSSRSHDPLSGATSPISRSINTDSKVRSPISKRERRKSLSNLPPYLVCGPESTNYGLTKSISNVVPSKTKSSSSRSSSPLSNTSESEHNQTNSESLSSLLKTQSETSSNICTEDRIENQIPLHITESHSNSEIQQSSLDFLTDELSSSGQSSSPQTSLANQLLTNSSKAGSLPSISSGAEIKRRRRSNILRYDLFCKAILDTPQKTDCGKKILPNKWKTGENVDNSSAFSAKRKLSMGSDNPDIGESPAKMPRSDESDHGESPSIVVGIDKSDSEKKKQAMTSEQRRKKKRLLSMKTSVLMSDCDETEVISSPPTFDDAYKDASKSKTNVAYKSKTNVASSVKSVRKKNYKFKLSTPSSSKNQTLVGDIYTEVKFGLESQMEKVCKYILKRTVPVGLLNQLYTKACRPNAEDRSTLLKYCPNLKVGKFLDHEDSLIMKGYQQLVEQDLVTDKEKLLVEYAKIQTKTARARNILGLFVGQGILENRLAYDICDRLFVLLSGDPYFYQPYRKCEIRRSGKVGPYQKPQDKRNASRVKWTCDEDKQLLQHIINVTNTKAVEGINVTKTAWEMISEKIGRPVKLVRLHWLRILKPMLVLAEQDVPDDIDFKIKLFEAILDMNVKCRKEIDWIALEKNFPPRPSQALQNAYTSLIYRVDLPSHNEILQHCLRNLRMRKIDEDRRRLCNMVTEKEKHVKQVQEYYLSLIEN